MATYQINVEDCYSKESYIGDYAIINCQYYGNYNECKKLGIELKLGYDRATAIVQVKTKTDKVIGELQLSDAEKKVFASYLNMSWNEMLYMCKVSQIDEKAKINDRLRVTVWVKRLIKIS